MNEDILTSAALKEITGYKRDGSLKSFLEGQGIAVFEGKNGIWTTMELVNRAGLNKMELFTVDAKKEEWL